MNYSDETARRYKDEMLRLYRTSNTGSASPPQQPEQQEAMPVRPPALTNTPQQTTQTVRQPDMSMPQPPLRLPVPPPPEGIAQSQRRSVAPPPSPQPEDTRPYPFLMPDMLAPPPDYTAPPCNPELEYCDVQPREGDRFPPVRAMRERRSVDRSARRRTASRPSRTANVNGGARNSYNDSLPDESAPPSELTQQLPEPDDTGSGYLQLEASAADDAMPVENVFITVTRPTAGGTQSLVYMLTTDGSGKTREVELPAPPKSRSLSPEGDSDGKPFSAYTIRADKEGFFSIIGLDVPIFSGIKSIQPLRMIPVPEYEFSPPPIEYVTDEPDL